MTGRSNGIYTAEVLRSRSEGAFAVCAVFSLLLLLTKLHKRGSKGSQRGCKFGRLPYRASAFWQIWRGRDEDDSEVADEGNEEARRK